MEKTRKKVAVVARRENDILTILERTPGLEVTRLHPDSLGCCDLEPYDSFVLLGLREFTGLCAQLCGQAGDRAGDRERKEGICGILWEHRAEPVFSGQAAHPL